MWIFAILFAADVAVACLYAKKSFPTVDVNAFWLKMLASFIFVISGSIAYTMSEKGIYAKFVIAALVFGLVGDALLSIDPYIRKNENSKRNLLIATILGAAAFLIGHICYIIAFIEEIKIRKAFRLPVFLGIWILMLAIAVIAIITMKLKPGKLGPPMLIYTTGLCAMTALSICLALFGFKGNLPLRLILIVAPLIFTASDATLGLKFSDSNRFSTARMRYLTLLTYYPAQMLFGLSVMLVK